jgi:hypothetical protein
MRINLFCGPGGGKSTTAHWLTGRLKEAGRSVEYVGEWIKEWAYARKVVGEWDQFRVFAEQMELERKWLRNGVADVVTDSPMVMQVAYMRRDGCSFADACADICRAYEAKHPSFNLFLDRSGVPYASAGRWEQPDQAAALDRLIRAELDDSDIPYLVVPTLDRDRIMEEVLRVAV